MIVLDTHIWVWWVLGDNSLTSRQATLLEQYEPEGLGVSAISCWEVAKLVEYKRLVLPFPNYHGKQYRSEGILPSNSR